jgi:hypothetical protein
MPGKKWLMTALLAVLTAATGCCGLCDHWCKQTSCASPAPAGAVCCVPCCGGGTVAQASPAVPAVPAASGWNNPVQPTACCVPCR